MLQETSTPRPLNAADVKKSIDHNQAHPNRNIGYNVPLPNWQDGLHVGAVVVSKKNNNAYVIVDIVGTWAVIVPLIIDRDSPPVCAYTCELDKLAPSSVREIMQGVTV